MILSNISKAKTAQKNMLLYSRISVNVSGWKTEIKSSWQKRLVVWVHDYTKPKTNNSPIFFLQKFISLPFSLTFHFFQEYEIMYTLQIFLNEVETVIASHRTYWNLFYRFAFKSNTLHEFTCLMYYCGNTHRAWHEILLWSHELVELSRSLKFMNKQFNESQKMLNNLRSVISWRNFQLVSVILEFQRVTR